jgi:hypothetical protein
VSLFYNESLVKSIESLDFMKKLIKSSFITWLQNFWKGWFKQVFIFFGYVSIIFWLVSIVIWVFDLLDYRYFRWLVSVILSLVMAIISVVSWFWMIKFKVRYPFIVLLSFVWQVIVALIPNQYWYMYYSRGSSIWTILFSLLFFMIWYALILKNKELFINK